MNLINEVYDSLRWKKNDAFCAHKLGITVQKYRELKTQILQIQDMLRQEKDEVMKDILNKRMLELMDDEAAKATYIADLEEQLVEAISTSKEKVIEFREDLEEGTAHIKGISFSEPKDPKEIERILKIDTSKWKLSTYWNKEQKGYWLVSAQVSRKKGDELTVEEAAEIISKIMEDKTYAPIHHYPVQHNDKALFVYTSDKHIAAYVDGSRAMFDNKYDRISYDARMKLILHEVIYLQSVYGTFRDIYVIDLGDKMDGLNGYTTRGGHKLPQNMSNRQAFETALSVEKDFYDRLFTSGAAQQYHILHNCNSNHGGDFDYMVNRALEEYVNAKYPDVRTRILEKFIEHEVYGTHTILMTHGKDDTDMKHGLPLNLNDKTESYLSKYLMYYDIDPKKTTVSVVKADLHTNNSQDAFGFRYRNVLSLFGGSKWVGTNFGPSKPGCSFDIYERDTDRVWEHRIFFTV